MTDHVDGAPRRKSDGGLIARFWGFEELLGNSLIKIVYYIGLFVIVISTVLGLIGGVVGAANEGGAGMALLMFILVPIGGIVSLIFWRFFCELSLLAFLTYDRLGDIKDKLP